MQAAVTVSYFPRKIGPMVYYSYPEDALKEEEKVRLADIMDQAFEEGFFTHRFGDLTSMNYYFEIQSDWARGNKEMLMISVIMDSVPNQNVETTILSWSAGFSTRLKNNKEGFKAFYNLDDAQVTESDVKDIKKYSENIRFWVKELYWMAIEELREKTEEEKWAIIMSRPQIFKVIKKLSKGPYALKDLEKWFKTVFPQHQLEEILTKLEEDRFIFVNSIGMDTYVLLVKDVNIMRVPPNCIIDLEEDSPELSDLTDIYINEVREFFETYSATPMDALELFKLFADPKTYNVISQLREGPLPKEKILSMVSEKTTQNLLKNLNLLVNKSIIQEFSYSGEFLYILKTDVVLTASFPQYLRILLPEEAKGYVAQAYTHTPIRSESMGIEIKPEEGEQALAVVKEPITTDIGNPNLYQKLDAFDEEDPQDQRLIAEQLKTLFKEESEEN